MARTDNPLLKITSGKIGDVIVVKQYSYGTVISAIPDMSSILVGTINYFPKYIS